MNFKDFSLLFTVCFVWGLNIVVTRWVVFDAAVPPIFFAGLRFLGVALLLIPFLRPIPKDIKTLFLISFFIGSGHFALLFVGLANAEASSASIVSQLGVPFMTLMSMAFLGETIGWRRGLGIMLAFAGSIFGHGAFYHLIKKYDISLLSPLTLMTPIWGVVLSIILLNDAITSRLVLGAIISLGGVFVIAVRPNTAMPEAGVGKKLSSGGS